MRITFFKIPKHRSFDYKPRYYNADKEELNERIRKMEESARQSEDGEYVFKRENINFRKNRAANQKRIETKFSNKRILVYTAILLFVIAVFVSIRNFSYLISSENDNKKIKVESKENDWDTNTQIVIVDEDAEITENTDE
ncbi:MAG: hypothetical protein LBJ63_09635 [Prevotellaceae bacterium]|jgi:hypothetical protein|nr:hypothetical protein [Prevotellaceae bacterium]